MEFVDNKQVDLNSLRNISFDLFLYGDNKTQRSLFFRDNFKPNATARVKISPGYNPPADIIGNIIRDLVQRNSNEITLPIDLDEKFIHMLFDALCNSGFCRNNEILIDYSCISPNWNAAIINYLIKNDNAQERLFITYVYTPSRFFPPAQKGITSFIPELMVGREKINDKRKPLSLILGLGYHQDAAMKIIDAFKPDKLRVLISDPAFDPDFFCTVKKLNKKLLKKVPTENIFYYPAGNPFETKKIITDIVLPLRCTSHAVIAPLGPKILNLCSLLVYAKYPDVSVYMAGREKYPPVHDQLPQQEPVLIRVEYQAEDDENLLTPHNFSDSNPGSEI